MVGGSKVKIKPECVVCSFMGMPRIIYKIKIFLCIVIIIYYFMLYCMEIQQLISNIDS